MLTCQMSVGEAVVAVMRRAWRSGRYETWREKTEDIVRLSFYQRMSEESEEKDHADTPEKQKGQRSVALFPSLVYT